MTGRGKGILTVIAVLVVLWTAGFFAQRALSAEPPAPIPYPDGVPGQTEAGSPAQPPEPIPYPVQVQQAEASGPPAVNALAVQAATDPALASAMVDAAQTNTTVAQSLLTTAVPNGQTAQPVFGPDPSAPADGTRRCYNSSWTRSWLEVAGSKIGQVEEINKGYCASKRQRIDKDYGWHGDSWAWGPWCITNYDSFHAWKDIPFSKQGTATGSVGVQYPWGCGGVRTIHATHIITASGRTYGKW